MRKLHSTDKELRKALLLYIIGAALFLLACHISYLEQMSYQ